MFSLSHSAARFTANLGLRIYLAYLYNPPWKEEVGLLKKKSDIGKETVPIGYVEYVILCYSDREDAKMW